LRAGPDGWRVERGPDHGDRADTWDDYAETLARARPEPWLRRTRDTTPLRPRPRVLEYGAEAGLLSEHLAPQVMPLVLADPPAAMREVMLGKIECSVFPSAPRVLDLDLTPHQRSMHDSTSSWR
jgi:hypothetical protein